MRCVAEDHFTIDVDEGCGAAALARLNKFKIRVKCDFGVAAQSVLALRGLDAAARAAVLAQPGAVTAWRETDGAVDLFGDSADGFGAPRADLHVYEAERVRCSWPIFGVDIDTDTIPAETSLVDVCVSFTKGCYPGQELVERMDSRGSTAPRRLMRLPAHPANGRNATVGESYVVGGVSFGLCTSVADDFALVMVTRAHLGEAEALVSP
ncbi:MAG: hypothetical protein ACKPCO_07190 [Actinomycetota bacterium]